MSYSYTQLFRDYLYSQEFQEPLKSSLEYILFNEGHWVRPQLVLAWCEYCGGNPIDALPLALAIEYVHTASLIHDDLPSMDNATERRGQECLHLAYSEATAVLTGDALLNMAFTSILHSSLPAANKNYALAILSEVNSSLCNGQLMELNVLPQLTELPDKIEQTLKIHSCKTADLIKGACLLGVAASGKLSAVQDAENFGFNLGMLYQILDDIADQDGLTQLLSKEQIIELKQIYKNQCILPNNIINNGYRYLDELLHFLD